jgi:uncharacterized membrane protein
MCYFQVPSSTKHDADTSPVQIIHFRCVFIFILFSFFSHTNSAEKEEKQECTQFQPIFFVWSRPLSMQFYCVVICTYVYIHTNSRFPHFKENKKNYFYLLLLSVELGNNVLAVFASVISIENRIYNSLMTFWIVH